MSHLTRSFLLGEGNPFNVGPDGSYTLPDGSLIIPPRPQTPQISPAYLAAQKAENQRILAWQKQQASTMEQSQKMGTPAPNYDPSRATIEPTAPTSSQLPLIIGGLAALGIAGFLWWKFRK